MMGEVHTGLLHNLGELPEGDCRAILGLIAGERVRTSLRPQPHAISPELLVGVDCHLPSLSGTRIRGIGTVAHRATITGGRVLQGSSYVRLTNARRDHRAPWSHYLSRPGVVEAHGRHRRRDLADGFLAARPPMESMNLGAISARLMNLVQGSPVLNHRPPFKTARTRLRWVLECAPTPEPEPEPPRTGGQHDRPTLFLNLGEDTSRSLRIMGEPALAVVAFCEDLALHDWLLTTLQTVIQRALIGTGSRTLVAAKLAPAIDHLLHLWMPGARVDDAYLPFWEELERKPGFTRQWTSSVERIRDQIAVNTLSLLSVMTEGGRRTDGNPGPRRGVPQAHP